MPLTSPSVRKKYKRLSAFGILRLQISCLPVESKIATTVNGAGLAVSHKASEAAAEAATEMEAAADSDEVKKAQADAEKAAAEAAEEAKKAAEAVGGK